MKVKVDVLGTPSLIVSTVSCGRKATFEEEEEKENAFTMKETGRK